MKTTFTFLIILLSLTYANSQNIELPFFEDFEESISNDGTFLNWTTENNEGWQYWHIIPWGGFESNQCMRFENNDLDQNDWLITKAINTGEADSLLIHFYSSHNLQGTKPKLLYTTDYSGNAANNTWTEIQYELGENTNQWSGSRDIKIKAPSSNIWFAFHSNQEASKGIYFLLDNFSVSKYDPVRTTKTGETEHFEFYTDNEANTDFWLEIKDALENSFQKYCGIWNIQGKEDFIDKDIKTKIYYFDKTNIPYVNETTPETKSGFFDRETKSIYLSPLNTTEKQDYYESLEGLAINTFAGYAKKHQLFREQNGNDGLPNYFIEGFGLYEQGFRPRLDSIINFRSIHPGDLTHKDLDAMNIFSGTSQKDIIVSYVEGQIIGLLDYYGTAPYSSYIPRWNNHLVYFYDTTDVVRIKKYASNENFDIYCSSRDTMFIDSFFVWLERPRQLYIDSFQIEVKRKFNLMIYYDEKTGMDMTGYDNWNGGAGGLDISPHNFPGPDDDYPWLLAHEFGHVYNSVIYPEMPGGFYQEGMANLSGFFLYGSDWSESRGKIESVLYCFNQQYGREPKLNEFINNPYWETQCYIDPYYFGLEFMRYLHETEGTMKIKEFFTTGMDFSVFSQSYQELEAAYIRRLKRYRNLCPTDTLVAIPFDEPFDNFFNGWSKPSYSNHDNWQINDGGLDGGNCARFYTYSDKNVPIESWLISPPLYAKNMEQIYFSFDFARYGDGIESEVFYTDNFEEFTDSSNWTKIKTLNMPTSWNWSSTGSINVSNPPDTVYIGIKMSSSGEQNQQFYIDNFKVNGNTTGFESNSLSKNEFKIYPNPLTNTSIITFTNSTLGEVNLSVYDLQGRKICTVLNKNMPQGKHTISMGNHILTNGVYLCKLVTSKGISTLKLVVDK